MNYRYLGSNLIICQVVRAYLVADVNMKRIQTDSNSLAWSNELTIFVQNFK